MSLIKQKIPYSSRQCHSYTRLRDVQSFPTHTPQNPSSLFMLQRFFYKNNNLSSLLHSYFKYLNYLLIKVHLICVCHSLFSYIVYLIILNTHLYIFVSWYLFLICFYCFQPVFYHPGIPRGIYRVLQ